jgi:phosphoglycerate dehydrogenase-like enzyme
MTLKVHLAQGFDKEWLDRFKEGLDDRIELTQGTEIPSPAEYEILVAGVPTREQITASPKVKMLIIPWSGLPVKTRELMLEFPDIAVHNIHHNAISAAEAAVTLMMAAARKLIPIDRTMRKHDWRPRYDLDGSAPGGPLLLSGKSALIVGYGAIGKHIAAICRGLGMKIIGIRSSSDEFSESDIELYTLSAIPQLLPRANVLFICLPFTPETKGLIGANELDALPDEAIIVNIARGPIIDEEGLYTALKEGNIRAGLDVWYSYPQDESSRSDTTPSRFPFHELDNVVMTPHLGGHSDQTETLRIAQLQNLLNKVAAGEELPNHVDLERGY